MLHAFHDFHLIFHSLVGDPILHEPPLVQLFGSVGLPVVYARDFVDCGERTLPDLADSVVAARPIPLSWQPFHVLMACLVDEFVLHFWFCGSVLAFGFLSKNVNLILGLIGDCSVWGQQ